MRADPTLTAESAFTGLPLAAGSGRGVIATERDGLGIARVAARRGQGARLAQLWRAQFGVELPNAPRRVSAGEVEVAGIGPQAWLATREEAGGDFAASLRSSLGESASIADVSDAYAILRLAGPKVRETLAKLVPIDVHPRSLRENDLAQTLCGYVSVVLWRLQDDARLGPAFEIWTGRSYAASLHQAICDGAAEFGFEREPPGHPRPAQRQTA